MLLERQEELGLAGQAMRDAHSGVGSLILVRGPFGDGKSSLLAALPQIARVSGLRVLRAAGSWLEQDFAFGIARQLFDPALTAARTRTRLDWLSGEAGLAHPVFSEDAPPGGDAPAALVGEAALRGLTALARAMSADQPYLMLIDDLQWADEPSLRWLRQFVQRLDSLPVVVVATVLEGDRGAERPTVTEMVSEVAAGRAHELRLAPLSAAATAALAEHHLGRAASAEFVDACVKATGGSPVLLTAALFNLRHRATAPDAANVAEVRELHPAQLRERLIHCLCGQDPAVRAVACATAVLGEHVDVELIAQLAELDVVGYTVAVRTLRRLGLFNDECPPRFAHPIVQEAVEESLTAHEREQLHLQAITLLHACGYPAEQVAAQLMAVTTRQGGWTIDVLRAAASTALRRGAPEVAARYLRRALVDASPNGADRAELLVDLATAEREFDPAASARHTAYAVPMLRSARGRADAVMRIAPSLLLAPSSPLRELIGKVVQDLGDPAELPAADRDLAFRLEARLRYTHHADRAELDDAVRRLIGLGEDVVATAAGRELMVVLLHEATLTAKMPAREVARRGKLVLEREQATPSHAHTGLPLLVLSLVAAGASDETACWLDQARERARAQRSVIEHAVIRSEQAFVLLGLGRPSEARRAALEACDLAAPDWNMLSPTTAVGLARVAVELREPRLLARLQNHRHELDDATCYAAVCRMLSGAEAEMRGDLCQALEHFLACGRQLDRSGWRNPVLFPWRLAAARLHHELGEREQALGLAEEARTDAVAWGAPVAVGRGLRVVGELTGGVRGQELLHEAVAVLAGTGNGLEQARALRALGLRLRADGAADATAILQRASALARRAGADWLVTGRGRSAGNVLTSAETRVARLAVAGRTNREIADTLQVTCRAVEKHLTNSFRKLGVRRRTELADALAKRPQ